MTERKDTPKWLQYYHQQLDARNKSQSKAFCDLIKNYSEVTSKCKNLEEQLRSVEREKLITKALSYFGRQPPEVFQLNEKVRKLESELNGTYKENQVNTMQVLELTRNVRELEYEKKDMETKLQAAQEYNNQNAMILSEKSLKIEQLESFVETSKQEIAALKDGKKQLEQQVIELMNNNQNLVNKIVVMKQEVAEHMNEASEIYEKALQMMKTNNDSAKLSPKGKEKDDLTDYMLTSLSAPLKASVPEKPKFKIAAHNHEALSVKYDNFGNSLATCGGDNIVKVWDPTTGKELLKFKDFSKPVTCLDYNLEGNLICAGSVDKTIRILDLKTQRAKHCFTGHSETVNSLCVLLRSPKIVSGSNDRTIKLWDYEKFQISSTTNYPSGVYSMDVAQDDNMLITGHNNGTLMFWSMNKWGKIAELKDLHHHEVITSVYIARDNHYVLTNGRDNIMKLIDLRKFDVVKEITDEQYTNTSNTNRACLSTDSKYVLVGGNSKVFVFDKDTSEIENLFEDVHQTRVLSCDWEPRGCQFATVDAYGGLIIWE